MVSKTQPLSAKPALTAFVDASVIAAYLAGAEDATRLFNNGYAARVRFALDPVVLQEVMSSPHVQESPDSLERVYRLDFEILSLNVEESQRLLARAMALRNRIAHSSDVLIVVSARECDYLITYDQGIKGLIEGDKPRVVTPEQFTALVTAA